MGRGENRGLAHEGRNTVLQSWGGQRYQMNRKGETQEKGHKAGRKAHVLMCWNHLNSSRWHTYLNDPSERIIRQDAGSLGQQESSWSERSCSSHPGIKVKGLYQMVVIKQRGQVENGQFKTKRKRQGLLLDQTQGKRKARIRDDFSEVSEMVKKKQAVVRQRESSNHAVESSECIGGLVSGRLYLQKLQSSLPVLQTHPATGGFAIFSGPSTGCSFCVSRQGMSAFDSEICNITTKVKVL